MATNRAADRKIGMWDATRDIAFEAMRRGQLLPCALAATIIIMVARMAPADIGPLANRLLDLLHGWSLYGYLIAVAAISGWVFHVRWTKAMMGREIDRLSAERNDLQTKQLGTDVQSSEE